MNRAFIFLAGIACLAGCQRPAAPGPAAKNESSTPRFAATVGQLDQGTPFLTFIERHEHQIVDLDLQFPRGEFQGGKDVSNSYFDIWEDCEDLPKGQKPGGLSGGCTGFEFSIPSAQAVVQSGSVRRLRGKFRVEPAGGPLQGLMVVQLLPVTP